MIPPIEEIRQNYSKLPDQKLLHLATMDAKGLRPEALEALKAELSARGLSENLDASIDVQMKGPTSKEISEMVSRIRKLNCPVCHQNFLPLNAIKTYTVISYVLATNSKDKLVTGCKECLLKKNQTAFQSSVLAGWWGIPWGLIRTPKAIKRYFDNKRKLESGEPTDVLLAMVQENAGLITKIGEDSNKLKEWISDISA